MTAVEMKPASASSELCAHLLLFWLDRRATARAAAAAAPRPRAAPTASAAPDEDPPARLMSLALLLRLGGSSLSKLYTALPVLFEIDAAVVK